MINLCSARFYTLGYRRPAMILVIAVFISICFQPQASVAEERPPEVKVLSTIKNGGGYGQELHRVTIKGIARTAAGDPVKGADIFVSSRTNYIPGDFERLRGRTKSDANGYFELKDIQLLVIRQRANPIPKPAEGGFVVFGTNENYGYTWHATRVYRPYARPKGVDFGDKDKDVTARAFYQNDPITVDLMFEAPAKLRGRITNDLGQPLAGAKVQIGLVDHLRTQRTLATWSCQFLGNENDPVASPVRFDGIHSLPAKFRETRTDKNGEYEFKQLRRDTRYLALIDPGLEYATLQFHLSTSQKETHPRTKHTGYDGKLDHEFIAPRNVTARVVDSETDQPVPNVLVTARHIGGIRRAGIQARSDSQGNASLHLMPGEYKLTAEPAPDQPFVFSSQQYFVPEKTNDVTVSLKLRPAAIVKLKVTNKETGQPIPNVRFNYETDTSSKQLPLSSQTVFVDYPKTNAAGELQVFATPGMRRIVVAEPLTLAQADESRGELLKLTGGKTTEIQFRLSIPQFLPSQLVIDQPQPDKYSIYPPELQIKWNLQAERINKTPLRITARQLMISRGNLAAKALLAELRALDPDQVPDLFKILEKHRDQKLRWWKLVLTSDGDRYREDRYYNSTRYSNSTRREKLQINIDGQRLPNSSAVFNGWTMLRYSDTNNQANASGRRRFAIHVDTVRDLCNWPFLQTSRPRKKSDKRPDVKVSKLEKRVVFEMKSERATFRRVCDQQTGFIFETSYGASLDEPDRVKMYFAPKKYAGGLILPSVYIYWTMYQGKFKFLNAYLIDKVEILESVPADAFAINLPTGAMIVDSRHVPANASRRGPVRSVQTILRAPVSDMAAYLNRHPRISTELESTIQYGKPAPKIKPAKWLTAEGESGAPDLAGKVVLVEFWGTRCGPCLGQLPDVRTAARHYEDQPFVLIGMHDSYTTVDKLQAFAQKESIKYQLAIDQRATEKGWFGKTMRDFGVRGIPKAAVIDQKGNVAFVGTFNEALRTVDRLLKQKK